MVGPNDQFVILGCDGLWEALSNQDAVNFTRRCLSKLGPDDDLQVAARKLVDRALCKGSKDNITALIAVLANPAC